MMLALYRRRAFRKKCERARCSGALSIKPLEGSRPWLRRTRALCKFNCGKVRCRDAPRLCDRARQTTPEDEAGNEESRESRAMWFVERQGRERLSVLTHAEVSCGRDSFHAATVTKAGGERSPWEASARGSDAGTHPAIESSTSARCCERNRASER